MKLSLRGEYALRALIELGEAKPGEIVPIHIISEQQQIPKRFLEQILNDLRSGGFVESKRGIAGGYQLARSPEDIGLAQVIWYIEGTLTPSAASKKKTKLKGGAIEAQQAILEVMKDVCNAIVNVLNQVTLADLCERTHQLRQVSDFPEYMI
jgi:Rrf2 family cysteine metabolism transcriptional repressor